MKSCPERIYLNMCRNRRGLKFLLIAIVIATFGFGCRELLREREKKPAALPLREMSERLVMEPYLPGICRLWEGDGRISEDGLLFKSLLSQYPGLLFAWENGEEGVTESDYARIFLSEGSDEDHKGLPEEALDYGDDAMHLEKSLESAFLKENSSYLSSLEEEGEQEETAGEDAEEHPFVPAEEKSYRYQWEELSSYEELIKAFYAVDSTTVAGEQLLSTDTLLEKDMRIQGSADEPQILIYHTHSREGFADSVPGDENSGILGAGEYLATLLRDRYGYNVVHNSDCYDKERDYAYSNSLPAIEAILKEYPSIEVVIDLHRDSVAESTRLVTEIEGRQTARFMFFNGLSRVRELGEISYLPNENLQGNLAFSFQLQKACEEYYPGLTRKIYLKGYRYNMHLKPRTVLVELGAQNNTVQEAMNACGPLARVIDMVLGGE